MHNYGVKSEETKMVLFKLFVVVNALHNTNIVYFMFLIYLYKLMDLKH